MVDNSVRETFWNYIVFNRVSLANNPNKTGFSEYFAVHIVRENFIPEGLEIEVIDKMCDIAGMRLSAKDVSYTYVQKPNTDIVVEMASIEFLRPKKRDAA